MSDGRLERTLGACNPGSIQILTALAFRQLLKYMDLGI
jgi:hypothetical protein